MEHFQQKKILFFHASFDNFPRLGDLTDLNHTLGLYFLTFSCFSTNFDFSFQEDDVPWFHYKEL